MLVATASATRVFAGEASAFVAAVASATPAGRSCRIASPADAVLDLGDVAEWAGGDRVRTRPGGRRRRRPPWSRRIACSRPRCRACGRRPRLPNLGVPRTGEVPAAKTPARGRRPRIGPRDGRGQPLASAGARPRWAWKAWGGGLELAGGHGLDVHVLEQDVPSSGTSAL